MMSGSNNDPLHTISAAATAIAMAETRVHHASAQKKRWRSFLGGCFGSHKHNQRIGHAVLVPEPTSSQTDPPPPENSTQQSSAVLPFIAPPSSPASFLQSEPPSCTQSPGGVLSLTSVSPSMYSPGPANMFAIGPYAHETQLVSPPVFSTFTTQPSTAPYTPPPESVQFTTPSSPEVPFARLLDQRYPISQQEFQSYQLYSGQLISPNSGISTPGDYTPNGSRFLQFQNGYPSKLFNLDRTSVHKWGSQQGSGALTPDSVGPRSRDGIILNRQDSDLGPLGNSFNKFRNSENLHDPRISFEITAEDVVRCMAKEPSLAKAISSSVGLEDIGSDREREYDGVANGLIENNGGITDDSSEKGSGDDEGGQLHRKHRSATLDSIKEFNFEHTDGWANEKALGKEGGGSGSYREWSFFPMIQPDVR